MPDVAPVLLLVLLAFLTYSGELLLGLRPMDMDVLVEGIPTLAWLGQLIRTGDSPLWAPGVLGGFPLAFGQYSLFDPVAWVAAMVLDANRAAALVRATYLALAGIAAYGYARALKLSPAPSLMAAVGYELSTEAAAMPPYGNGVQSLFLLPTLLLSTELAARRGLGWAGLGAGAVGLSMAAGGAYVTAIALLNTALYAPARVLLLWRAGLRRRSAILPISTAAAVALGMGLAAFRILPTLAITAESVRSHGMSLAAAATGSPGLAGLLAGYLLPLSRLTDLGNRGEFHAPGYVGPAILILAGLALPMARRSPWVALFFGLALFNVLASLGSTGPLFAALHDLPGMGYFRGPARFSTASALFLSLLAAWALHEGTPPKALDSRGRLRAAAMLATLAALVALAGGALWLHGGDAGAPLREFAEANRLGPANPLRPRIALALLALPTTLWLLHARVTGRIGRSAFSGLCVGLTAGLLLVANLSVTVRQQEPSDAPATARFLQQDGSLFRVMSHASGMTLNLHLVFLAGGDSSKVDAEGPRELDFRYRYMAETLSSNLALQYGLQSVDGHALLQSIRQAIALSYMGSTSSDLSDFGQIDRGLADRLWDVRSRHLLDHVPLLRAYNVRYVLSSFELWQHSDLLRLVFTSRIPMLHPETLTNVHVYEVLGSLPRAYLVPESLRVDGPEEALDALLAGTVEPASTVLLEQPAPSLGEPRLDPARCSVTIQSYRNTEVRLDLRTDGSGFLVVNDAFHPGWRAWVDGQAAPVYVANGWVRAIPIPGPGEHSVHLTYSPPLFAEGLAVSGASAAILLAALIAAIIRRHLR